MRYRLPVIIVLAAAPTFATTPAAYAQDPFELEVYTPATASAGEWELEARTIYVVDGSTTADGTVAPTDHQTRLTVELTHGLSRRAEVTVYGLAALRPGAGFELAGWRAQARVRAPDGWRLPVDLGLSVETGHTTAPYSDHAYAVELAPIVGKRWGRVNVAVNARFEKGLGGATDAEWEFEPAGSIGVMISRSLTLTTEYFSSLGELNALASPAAQTHLLFPGISLRLGDDVEWNAAIGIGLSAAADRLSLKTAVEFPLRD